MTRLTCPRDHTHVRPDAVHHRAIIAVFPDIPQGNVDTTLEATTRSSAELGFAGPRPYFRLPDE